MLPRRLTPPKSGIARAPQRIWPKHRRFVRGHACCVPGCESSAIEFAHIRSAANAGASLKPFDWFAVSLCSDHHEEQHARGVETFMRKYGVNLWSLAAEFAYRSPDLAMKAAMPQVRHFAPWAPLRLVPILEKSMRVKVTITQADGSSGSTETELADVLRVDVELAADANAVIRALNEEGRYRCGGGAAPIVDIERIGFDSGIRLTKPGEAVVGAIEALGLDHPDAKFADTICGGTTGDAA